MADAAADAAYQPNAEELLAAVKEVKGANPEYGIKRIWTFLKDEKKWSVSEKRVKTLMQENNLVEASGGDASAPAGDAEGKKKGDAPAPAGDAAGKKKGKKKVAVPGEQTWPIPTVPISELFPSGVYPPGETAAYVGDNAYRSTKEEGV
ncbi:hypothetical protein T484DRAFT_1807481 [Baffinella frigidus]|nr:hypothetical protein T484DRAFT_1807481 [Cryptophyta sp. CCMP2293]